MKNEGLNKIAVQISCDLSNVIIYSKNEGKTITIKKHYHWCDVSLIEHIESNNCGLMVFSDTITKLNDGAFSYTALTSITIPKSVKLIGDNAFIQCAYLKEFRGKFASDDGRCLVNGRILKRFAPAGLSEYTIPDNIAIIGVRAFESCKILSHVIIPNAVVQIGRAAFYNCGLLDLVLPDSVREIECDAFAACKELKWVQLPAGSITIGSGAFLGCDSLEMFSGECVTSDHRCIAIQGELVAFAPARLLEYRIPEYLLNDVEICDNSLKCGLDISKDYRITKIGDYTFCNCRMLRRILFPNSITEIGNGSFRGCDNLTEISLPNSVKEIKDSAFEGCSKLRNIILSNSVVKIGNSAFSGCRSLSSVYIPESVTEIGDGVFGFEALENSCYTFSNMDHFEGKYASEDGRCLIVHGELKAFAPKGITEYIIPSNVTKIAQGTFKYCQSLKRITLPKTVKEIANEAFYGCKQLTTVIFPEGLIRIGCAAFAGCVNLKNVVLPNSVTEIGTSAFSKCLNLNGIILPSRLKAISNSIFAHCSNLNSIIIPEEVNEIGNNSFDGCRNLKEISIPNGVAKIGTSAFRDCVNLTNVELPEKMVAIGEAAFTRCQNLMKIIIPKGLLKIADSTFSGCRCLQTINIPSSVKQIGNMSFSCCKNLKNISIPEGVMSIGKEAFMGCTRMTQVEVPRSLMDVGIAAFQFCNIRRFIGPLASRDGRCLIVNGEIKAFATHEAPRTYSVQEGVTSIGEYAFSCDELVKVILPSSVISIKKDAFTKDSLFADAVIVEKESK